MSGAPLIVLMCVNRGINATAMEPNEPVEIVGPEEEVFGEKMQNDKCPKQCCLFSISLCVYIM